MKTPEGERTAYPLGYPRRAVSKPRFETISMDVREAVVTAKNWVKDMLSDEGVSNIGLEEVQRDEAQGIWYITIGFSRPWNSARPNALSTLIETPVLQRAYRVIAISEPNGEVISMKKREDDAA